MCRFTRFVTEATELAEVKLNSSAFFAHLLPYIDPVYSAWQNFARFRGVGPQIEFEC